MAFGAAPQDFLLGLAVALGGASATLFAGLGLIALIRRHGHRDGAGVLGLDSGRRRRIDDDEVDAAVLGAAVGGLVVGDRVIGTEALRFQAA